MSKNILKMRSQIKMGETIMILVIFFFLLVFGIVFYAKYSIMDADQKKSENLDLLAIQIAQKVQFLPEIQCTTEGTIDYNCLDLMKLNALKNLPDVRKSIYGTLFPRTLITVEQVYPSAETWEIYGRHVANKTKHFFPVPVALFNATSNQHNFGYMNITVFT